MCYKLCDSGCYFEIQGLGKLAEKFPIIADTSTCCLKDFLVTPSPILSKLHRQQCESTSKDGQKLKITGMLFVN
jgi:phosphatidylinositol 4-kinase